MVARSGLWLGLCASLLLLSACDDSHKSGGKTQDSDSGAGDGDLDSGPIVHGDGDGDGPFDGGCVFCDGGLPDGAVVDLPEGSVGGFVFTNTNPPVALANVRITGPGDVTTTTGSDGFFKFEKLSPGDGIVRAESDDYTWALRPVTVSENSSVYLELFLKSVFKKTIDPTKGGSAKDKDSGGGVIFAADSFKRNDGGDLKGDATIAVAAVPEGKVKAGSSKGNDESVSGVLKGNTPVEVRVVDTDGAKLQIADGKEAEVIFPISTKSANPPDEIGLWSLDEKDGVWKKEGTATKTKDDEGKAVYKGKIKHMSWWTADELVPAENISCVRACVKQAAGTVASVGASVSISGSSSPFSSNLNTDANGCFYLDLEANQPFTAVASNDFGSSSVLSFTSGADIKTVAADKNACTDLGVLQLVAPAANGPRCPVGYELCGTECVDMRNNPTQCGTSCGARVDCTGEGYPYGTTCVNGFCACPVGWTVKNGEGYECVDTQNDPNNCGSIYNGCNTQALEICQAGKCVALTCSDNTVACNYYNYDINRNVVACVDTQNDQLNCGACGNTCDKFGEGPNPNMACVAGQCGCTNGTTMCKPYSENENFACVDTKTDVNNCGACGSNQGVPNAAAQCDYKAEDCVAGSCTAKTCPAGQTMCNGMCLDLANDGDHCGTTCGDYTGCDPTQICQNGACTNPNCGAGALACNHQCVPNDTANCGDCGNYCEPTESCDGVGCGCAAGLTACTSYPNIPYCSNLTNRADCGGCGAACQYNEACVENQGTYSCQLLSCDGVTTGMCDYYQDKCNDLLTEADNCGSCDFQCFYGSCQAGSCVCPTGMKPCSVSGGTQCVDNSVTCAPTLPAQ
ncbi:MAG: hypothetical protein QM778_26620 [Myxococcales bacterium]